LFSITKSVPSIAGLLSPSEEAVRVTITFPLPLIPAKARGISSGSVAFSSTEAVVVGKLALESAALNDCGSLSILNMSIFSFVSVFRN